MTIATLYCHGCRRMFQLDENNRIDKRELNEWMYIVDGIANDYVCFNDVKSDTKVYSELGNLLWLPS